VAGRFPIYADADVRGPLIKALTKAGWDVVRAIDLYPERSSDLTHFERAVAMGRILVTNDEDQEQPRTSGIGKAGLFRESSRGVRRSTTR
jgi:hypothetical protein